jgi:hypothetical protein
MHCRPTLAPRSPWICSNRMRSLVLLLACLPLTVQSQSPSPSRFDDEYESKGWKELEPQLPPLPKQENLIAFRVSPSDFRFYVDGKSLSVGDEGVVRYTLVASSAGGAMNVSYEGIRCKTWEFRSYAYGRSDNTWAKAGRNDWTAIQAVGRALPESILASDFFCPEKILIIGTAQEGLDALRRGKHSESLR